MIEAAGDSANRREHSRLDQALDELGEFCAQAREYVEHSIEPLEVQEAFNAAKS